MNTALLDQLVNAVLYEGYILYPYRASSKKNNRERFTFGRVYPEAYSRAQNGAEPCRMQTECLVHAFEPTATLNVSVRFLHPMAREIGVCDGPVSEGHDRTPGFRMVPELRVNGQLFQAWHEAVEREIKAECVSIKCHDCASGNARPACSNFEFPPSRTTEPIIDANGQTGGVIVRRQEAIAGMVEIAAHPIEANLFKVTVRIFNHTPVPESELGETEAILMRTMASTHTILQVTRGEFVSLTSPPTKLTEAAELCKNIGTWPVLVGDEEKLERDTLLSSPIILYDYPKIAPESAGPLFDGTEIDEILTLRILTMTEDEKTEMRRVDEQARRLLERAENLEEDALLKLHGTMRQAPSNAPIEFDDFFGAATPLSAVRIGDSYVQPGHRVRIRPKARADVLDLALEGQTAIVQAVEQDMEGKIHLAVVMENDPGKDLGLLRQPGHRFFYGVDEVEVLEGALG